MNKLKITLCYYIHTSIMAVNLINTIYLLFRLAPILIVAFFLFQSFIMWDVKGVIYLCGLLLCTFFTIAIDSTIVVNMFKDQETDIPSKRYSEYCNTITIGENGEYYSRTPLNMVVYSYTFFYLLIFIANSANYKSGLGILDSKNMKNEQLTTAFRNNIPTLLFFPLIACVDALWTMSNDCISVSYTNTIGLITIALLIGAICGVIWAVIVTSINAPQMQYFSYKNNEVCSRPTKAIYKCKPQV